MFLDQSSHTFELAATKPAAIGEPDRIEPEFGDVDVTLDMNVWWLFAVAGVEEATVWANSQIRSTVGTIARPSGLSR